MAIFEKTCLIFWTSSSQVLDMIKMSKSAKFQNYQRCVYMGNQNYAISGKTPSESLVGHDVSTISVQWPHFYVIHVMIYQQ